MPKGWGNKKLKVSFVVRWSTCGVARAGPCAFDSGRDSLLLRALRGKTGSACRCRCQMQKRSRNVPVMVKDASVSFPVGPRRRVAWKTMNRWWLTVLSVCCCCCLLIETTGSKASKEAIDLTRPRIKNVTLLPILALLDLSSMGGGGNNSSRDDGHHTFDGSSLLKTAQTAVAHVNARQLVPGYHLHLLVNDSKVSFYSIWYCHTPIYRYQALARAPSINISMAGGRRKKRETSLDITRFVSPLTTWCIFRVRLNPIDCGLQTVKRFPERIGDQWANNNP